MCMHCLQAGSGVKHASFCCTRMFPCLPHSMHTNAATGLLGLSVQRTSVAVACVPAYHMFPCTPHTMHARTPIIAFMVCLVVCIPACLTHSAQPTYAHVSTVFGCGPASRSSGCRIIVCAVGRQGTHSVGCPDLPQHRKASGSLPCSAAGAARPSFCHERRLACFLCGPVCVADPADRAAGPQ